MEKALFEPPGLHGICVTGLPCPNCGSELAFLEQYRRHYCYACGRYAPEGFGEQGAKRCPICTGILSYVTQYDRYYCFRCNAYPPEGVFMETRVEPTPSSPLSTLEPLATGETALVVEPAKIEDPKPVTAEPEPKTVSQDEEAKTISTEQEPQPVLVVPSEPPLQTEPALQAEQEPLREETVATVAKPALVRADILGAKKPLLLDLCKAYNLDPSGTKEQLRERLLSYLDDKEAEPQPETGLMEIPMVFPQTSEEPTKSPTPEERVTETKHAPRMVITAAPRMIPEMPKKVVESIRSANAQIAPAVVESAPPTSIGAQPVAVPEVGMVTAPAVVTGPQTTIQTAKVEHPCPTCARELTFIPQYNRWYCYACRAYAPKARSKFACPNCGAALRWIPQYQRWWCDACRKYAPADLPRPERASIVGTSAAAVARGASMAAATIVHRHRSPGSGIGLVGFGMVLFVLYEVLVDLPVALSTGTASLIAPDVAFGLRFFAFVFVAVGAIMGLYAVRDRR